MKFLCLAYGAAHDWKALDRATQDTLLEQDARLRDRGALMAAVEPSVTTVRASDGTPVVTPEPFVPHDVPLAGLSIIEADSLDEAVRLVAGTPCAVAGGAIEILPILMINDAEWKTRHD
ncbi:MAG: YciI family protein [Vicinamibacterales bacterium]